MTQVGSEHTETRWEDSGVGIGYQGKEGLAHKIPPTPPKWTGAAEWESPLVIVLFF